MQKQAYWNAIKLLRLARESRNRDAARAALQRAKLAKDTFGPDDGGGHNEASVESWLESFGLGL